MTAPRRKKLDLVGLRDIATLLGVDGRTPTKWRARNILPEEDGMISGTFPVWERNTILRWAIKTKRGAWAKKSTAELDRELAALDVDQLEPVG